MSSLSPKCLEDLAVSYATLILAGEKTIDDVPATPARLRIRVEELVTV